MTCDDFVLDLLACELCFVSIICALTSFIDSTLWLIVKIHSHSHSGHFYACLDSRMCMIFLDIH